MPTKTKVPCKHPSCPELVPSGAKYCEKHKAMHSEEIQSTAGRRYGSAWRKASKQFLQVYPMCEKCKQQGKYVRATVVDHVVPHRGDEKLFWDRGGHWQPFCKKHHDQKTGSFDSKPVYTF